MVQYQLKTFAPLNQKDWRTELQFLMAYRSTPHSVIGRSTAEWEPNYQSCQPTCSRELNHTTTPFGLLMLKGRGRAETDLGEQLKTSIQQGDMVLPQQHQSRTSCQLPSNQNHRPSRIGRGTLLSWKGIARGPCDMFILWNCGYNHRVRTMDYRWQRHWPGRAWHTA